MAKLVKDATFKGHWRSTSGVRMAISMRCVRPSEGNANNEMSKVFSFVGSMLVNSGGGMCAGSIADFHTSQHKHSPTTNAHTARTHPRA